MEVWRGRRKSWRRWRGWISACRDQKGRALLWTAETRFGERTAEMRDGGRTAWMAAFVEARSDGHDAVRADGEMTVLVRVESRRIHD